MDAGQCNVIKHFHCAYTVLIAQEINDDLLLFSVGNGERGEAGSGGWKHREDEGGGGGVCTDVAPTHAEIQEQKVVPVLSRYDDSCWLMVVTWQRGWVVTGTVLCCEVLGCLMVESWWWHIHSSVLHNLQEIQLDRLQFLKLKKVFVIEAGAVRQEWPRQSALLTFAHELTSFLPLHQAV